MNNRRQFITKVARLALLAGVGAGHASPASAAAPAQRAVDPFVQAKQLGRGVNFSALEAPNEGDWGIVLEEGFFELARRARFKTIRLPVKWSAHAAKTAPYTIDGTFFKRIDWAVDNATRRGLNIVVNIHHYDELMDEKQTRAERPRFAGLWRQIATRYKDRPSSVVFELCNEPTIMRTLWNEVLLDGLAAIRESNPTRNVIIGGGNWNSIDGLTDLKLPADDKHLIATFHYYAPMEFTHQGGSWVPGSDKWLGTEWGSDAEKAAIRADLDKAAKWGVDKKRPLWLGEFGAFEQADLASRARWTQFVARESERRGIPWVYFEFGGGFAVYDRAKKAWIEPLRRALIPS
jgi:endoglucanase